MKNEKAINNDMRKVRDESLPWQELYHRDSVSTYTVKKRIEWFDKYIRSEEHIRKTPTTYYGPLDPRRAVISPCKCSPTDYETVTLVKSNHNDDPRSIHYFVRCPTCDASAETSTKKIKAIFNWNLSNCSIPMSYRNIPFFGLTVFDPADAHARMKAIDVDLTLKVELTLAKKELSKKETSVPSGLKFSKAYIDRLIAYRDHARYAITLIEKEIADSGDKIC